MSSFGVLASKFTILKIYPIAILTPPRTKWRGNLILPICQKSLVFSPGTYVYSFWALASKLTILKINPIALLTLPSTKGGREFNFAYLAKKSYIKPQKICVEFWGSSFKIDHFENYPYCTFNPP